MAQLLVRQIEEKLVRKLKQRAGEHGVSMEEEHRRILREALLGSSGKRPSLKEYLLAMPDVGSDEDFARDRDLGQTLVTRNVSDVAHTGVRLLNPFSAE
jgi:plasmid stability protein